MGSPEAHCHRPSRRVLDLSRVRQSQRHEANIEARARGTLGAGFAPRGRKTSARVARSDPRQRGRPPGLDRCDRRNLRRRVGACGRRSRPARRHPLPRLLDTLRARQLLRARCLVCPVRGARHRRARFRHRRQDGNRGSRLRRCAPVRPTHHRPGRRPAVAGFAPVRAQLRRAAVSGRRVVAGGRPGPAPRLDRSAAGSCVRRRRRCKGDDLVPARPGSVCPAGIHRVPGPSRLGCRARDPAPGPGGSGPLVRRRAGRVCRARHRLFRRQRAGVPVNLGTRIAFSWWMPDDSRSSCRMCAAC